MGHHFGFGISGIAPGLNVARKWHQKATRVGNGDDGGHLGDFESSGGKMIEHEGLAEDKLVRMLTQVSGVGVGGAGN